MGDVRETVRAVAVVPLPQAPDVVEGVINLRGDLVPMFDLRARFGLPRRALLPDDQFVVADAAGRPVAFRADRVIDLLEASAVDPGEKLALPVGGYVAGVAKLPEGLVLIHDLSTFLSQSESKGLEEALASRRKESD